MTVKELIETLQTFHASHEVKLSVQITYNTPGGPDFNEYENLSIADIYQEEKTVTIFIAGE